MNKSQELIDLIEFINNPPELPEDPSPIPDGGTDVLYYMNNKTNAIFISVDGGEKVVNPDGKSVGFNDELFTSIDPDPSLLSDKQKIVVKDADFQASQDNRKHDSNMISWNGLSITPSNRHKIEDGTAVAVSAFGSQYFLVDTSDLDPHADDFKSIVSDRAKKELTLRLRLRGQGRTNYRLTSPFIK